MSVHLEDSQRQASHRNSRHSSLLLLHSYFQGHLAPFLSPPSVAHQTTPLLQKPLTLLKGCLSIAHVISSSRVCSSSTADPHSKAVCCAFVSAVFWLFRCVQKTWRFALFSVACPPARVRVLGGASFSWWHMAIPLFSTLAVKCGVARKGVFLLSPRKATQIGGTNLTMFVLLLFWEGCPQAPQ